MTESQRLLRWARLWALLAGQRRREGEPALARKAQKQAHLHFVRALYASPTYTNAGA